MKPLIIYHGPGCMDGAGAALAAWLRFGEEAEYRPAQYGDPAPTDDEVRGRDVYVLDFSYPRAELVRMDEAVLGSEADAPHGSLVVLDHHRTAQVDLAGLPFCTFDISKSGAVLTWGHLVGSEIDEDEPPELFRYIQDRDLWQWKLPHSREVSAALASSGALTDFRKLIPIYEGWDQQWGGSVKALANEGTGILRAERQLVERIVATAEEVEIRCEWVDKVGLNETRVETFEVLAATSAVLQSEVGEALAWESARRGRDAVGAVYYRDGAAGKWRVGLRSRATSGSSTGMGCESEAPDVSAVAKAFGGGGHVRAAGFECEQLPWETR